MTNQNSKHARSKSFLADPENYAGPLARQMREFIRQKQALGLKYETESSLLSVFDRYLRDNAAPGGALKREYVVAHASKRSGESDKSFTNRGTVLRQFGEYMGQLGYETYVLPHYEKHISSFVPYIFTHDEIAVMFKEIDKTPYRHTTKYAHKVYPVLFRVLYGCGLRVSEALNLRPHHVGADGCIRIESAKWNSERLVPMSDSLASQCREYYKEMHSTGRFEYFFPSSRTGGRSA